MNFWRLLSKYSATILISVVLVVFSLLVHRAFLNDTTYKGDDFTHHTLRTASYYLALKDGQFPVRWGPNLNQGFGYPSFNYMYHTPYLLGSFFHAAGFSLQHSVNLVILLATTGTLLFSYYFFAYLFKSKRIGLLLSFLFSFNPYILLTTYWRGAVGELLFYMAVPLFLLFTVQFFENNQYRIRSGFFLALTTAFLTLSHLPSFILFAPIVVVFLYTQYKSQITKQNFAVYTGSGLLGLGLTAWYWIPAILEQHLVRYVSVGSLQQYQNQFLSLFQTMRVFSSAQSSEYFTEVIQLGLPIFIAILFIVYYLLRKKIVISSKKILWLLVLLVSVLLTTNISESFWNTCKIIPYVQFPWRFLWPATFTVILLLANIFTSERISKLSKTFLYFFLIILTMIGINQYAITKGTQPRSDFDWFHPTFETGSSFDEHQPKTANFPYSFESELLYAPATATISAQTVASADSVIENVYLSGSKISFTPNTDEDIIVIIKRLFYPGWEARLEEEPTEILTNISDYEGVISLRVPSDTNLVTISFTGSTEIRTLSETISLISLILLFALLAYVVKTEHTMYTNQKKDLHEN